MLKINNNTHLCDTVKKIYTFNKTRIPLNKYIINIFNNYGLNKPLHLQNKDFIFYSNKGLKIPYYKNSSKINIYI